VPDSRVVKSAGFDPVATIISGREWSAESEETALYNVLPAASGAIEEYLCFRVANEEYAINIMAIKEIIKPREVTEVPRMPNFIPGVISLRGVIIPIMDMRLRLALPAGERTGRERVVVLRTDMGFCGVLVDEVVQVAKINRADIEDPPAVLDGIDRDFVKGLGRFDKRMLILLNLDTILDICVI
jgi:purine-binding chemotaxis protein CheW